MSTTVMSARAPELSKLVYFDQAENVIFVSKDHNFAPNVRSHLALFRAKNAAAAIEHVSMEAIAAKLLANQHNDLHNRQTAIAVSDMQQYGRTLFADGFNLHASDIHIRVCHAEKTSIIFRINGDLTPIKEAVASTGLLLCTAIYQSMTDISDANFNELESQDARISSRAHLPPGIDSIRVATSPQVGGFIMVLRLFYNSADRSNDLRLMGYSEVQNAQINHIKTIPTGINIIAGPTGSGKSTTIQRVLLSIKDECGGKKNIMTVEDPPEFPMAGIVQTPIANCRTEEERALAFQAAISAKMRQDPDVLMIGEVRDLPSVRLAIQAAMTGHQVWTTVHANNGFAIIDRMVDMGIPLTTMTDPSIVTGLICQRLLKVLCEHCKVPLAKVHTSYSPEAEARVLAAVNIGSAYTAHPQGCSHCRNTGIKGRIAAAEIIVPTEALMDYIRRGEKHQAKEYWRSTGGTTMRDAAIVLINAGLVDPLQAEQQVGPLSALEQ